MLRKAGQPIDPICPILLDGKGFCWAPSAAWGCSDAELCVKCKAKPRKQSKYIQASEMPAGVVLLESTTIEPTIGALGTCRFCTRAIFSTAAWRKKEGICRQESCWQKFVQELKFAI